MSEKDSLSDDDIIKADVRRKTGAVSDSSSSSSSSSSSTSKETEPPAEEKKVGDDCCCCWPHPYCPDTMCYDPTRKSIYQAPCHIGVIPMRSAAFQAPCVPLPKLTEHLQNDDDENECPEEDGVQFQFKPQTHCRTEVTFTIEPKPQPPWLTMLSCGFKPMVNCSAPPCYLSKSGNPGMNFCPGSQSFIDRQYGSQLNYCGMGNFPGMGAGDEDDSDSSGSDEESSSSEEEAKKKKKGGGGGGNKSHVVHRHHVKQDSSGTQLSRSSDWHG